MNRSSCGSGYVRGKNLTFAGQEEINEPKSFTNNVEHAGAVSSNIYVLGRN